MGAIERPRYLVFYKPFGVLSQFTPETGSRHPTLAAFISVPGVYPAGRLDHDSEGLLLLTSDGALQHRLSHPRFFHPKTYWAQVEGTPEPEALQQLANGVMIEGRRTRPAKVRPLAPEPAVPPRDPPIRYRKSIPAAWLEITITEGRNRQVRRMTASVNLPTLRLIRVAIGRLTIQNMQPGEWRDLEVTDRDLSSLLEKRSSG